MNIIIDGLENLFFKLQVDPSATNDYVVIVFALGCMVIGVLTVIVDCCAYYTVDRSPLALKHGKKTFLYFILWGGGAFIIGLFGQCLEIFVVSMQSCAFVGIGWPIMFAKMVDTANKEKMNHDDEPEQKVGD
ncbi:hypothetical protein [Vibrio porteresiae]|uniref:Uncharacterized protein n=1 Tax=Vibrio porteresiae DSM 19223 TaxID=1123496 RepID=A0ABZ0QI03_9VIBR|nr:hypothetical protein [Vibrio porteresiae]WPC75857.1 hypothetical protein R8Z52_23365 [Vibrio porteresiae DSM 19223]